VITTNVCSVQREREMCEFARVIPMRMQFWIHRWRAQLQRFERMLQCWFVDLCCFSKLGFHHQVCVRKIRLLLRMLRQYAPPKIYRTISLLS